MRQAGVYRNGELAGYLRELASGGYEFEYTSSWFLDADKPPLSLSFPKSRQKYQGEFLFPFFFNLLSEGANKHLQSSFLRVDERDSFGLLLATAQTDTIGAVTILPIAENEPS